MKLGKTKLKRMLSEETGIPPQDIADFGKYEYYGNKEQLAEICFIQESGKFVGYMKIRQQSVMSWKKKEEKSWRSL